VRDEVEAEDRKINLKMIFDFAILSETSAFSMKLDVKIKKEISDSFSPFHRDACHEAWTNLRLSPMFGCICPNNHMKRRCDKIFNVVNHNPCVGKRK
jgi:hypothetical protein